VGSTWIALVVDDGLEAGLSLLVYVYVCGVWFGSMTEEKEAALKGEYD
jgi:hypothetical protein